MPGLDDLYREVILDHYRSPRNQGELETPPAVRTEGFNPLCGDEVIVFVDVDDNNVITDIAIGGQGCSISQASASMMSAAIKGTSIGEARQFISAFKGLMSILKASSAAMVPKPRWALMPTLPTPETSGWATSRRSKAS